MGWYYHGDGNENGDGAGMEWIELIADILMEQNGVRNGMEWDDGMME